MVRAATGARPLSRKENPRVYNIVENLTMAERMGEITKMVSMADIAKKYFGKSRSWLAHKLNGNTVNGKAAQFSDEELSTLESALSDMSQKLGSMSVSI